VTRKAGPHRPQLKATSGARVIAADVVARVLDDGAWAQPALASALHSSSLEPRDKALCTELVYGTLRWAAPLEKSLLRSATKPGRGLDKRIRPHLLVAAYQLQHLSERIPAHAAVSEAVDAVRHVRPGLEGFANALLRRLGSPLHLLLKADAPLEALAGALGVPPFLAAAITEELPEAERRDALVALNDRPTTWALAFQEREADVRAHRFVPGMFALEGAVSEAAGFHEGGFVVLDPGSAVAALLVAPAPGARVLDLCAAPGGKTALLARAVGAQGHIVAVDQSDRRAARIQENLARLKLEGRAEVLVADARNVRVAAADAVLLDAPCTGLGTTRRKPEIKLRRTEPDIEADAKLQGELLEHAARLVKPGGVLVYSVCSPLPAEGRDQVLKLLGAHPELTLESARDALPWLPPDAVDGRGCVRLRPHRHDADAFFCARMRRSA
jgi:16S rRNA (cytosine967-C5)-methyltransferase